MNATVHVQRPPGSGCDSGQRESDKELVGSSPTQRNWRGILIAILVIVLVCSLIVVAVILVTPRQDDVEVGEPFTFEDLFRPELRPRELRGQWAARTDRNIYVYRDGDRDVLEYDVDNNVTTSIMDNTTFVHTYSFTAKYIIYNRNAKTPEMRLVTFPASQDPEPWRGRPLQHAAWAPIGHALTFVHDGDLYHQSDPHTPPTRLTHTGREPHVTNACPDWLYEEEFLHSNSALWWSPGAVRLLYASFNDTQVALYKFPLYGPGTSVYGHVQELPYPKAGSPRGDGGRVVPAVRLYSLATADLSGMHREISPPRQLRHRPYYVSFVAWRDDDHVLVGWTSRIQNETYVTLCHAVTTDCWDNLWETTPDGRGWVDMSRVLFVPGGSHYLTVLPDLAPDDSHWQHVVRISAKPEQQGARETVTSGAWDVSDVLAYDAKDGYVYFLSGFRDPTQRHLFRVVAGGGDPVCMTCDVAPDCQYVDATFSPSARYFLLHCLGPGLPHYTLMDTHSPLAVLLEDNADVAARLATKALPVTEFINFRTPDGEQLTGQLYLPPSLRREHVTQYPLLIHVEGTPGDQTVTERHVLDWRTYLTSSERVVYARVDVRGSGGRGLRLMHAAHRALGTVDVSDHIHFAEHIKKHYHFVDKNRIAIWGKSYGGFITAHALGDKNNVFKCGIAVSPITDLRYYDTAFTERYMGYSHSGDNYRGYDNANVSRKVDNFLNKGFLIIHGTADDKVHLQNSAQFIKALTGADVEFRMHLYTDKRHALSGAHTHRHLLRLKTRFLRQECWAGGLVPREYDPAGTPPAS